MTERGRKRERTMVRPKVFEILCEGELYHRYIALRDEVAVGCRGAQLSESLN